MNHIFSLKFQHYQSCLETFWTKVGQGILKHCGGTIIITSIFIKILNFLPNSSYQAFWTMAGLRILKHVRYQVYYEDLNLISPPSFKTNHSPESLMGRIGRVIEYPFPAVDFTFPQLTLRPVPTSSSETAYLTKPSFSHFPEKSFHRVNRFAEPFIETPFSDMAFFELAFFEVAFFELALCETGYIIFQTQNHCILGRILKKQN